MQEIKKMRVFVYVYKHDKSRNNPLRLEHTISAFAVMFSLDRGAQL